MALLGPFFPDDLETDFLTDVGGEANIEPQEGDTARSLQKTTPAFPTEIPSERGGLAATSATADGRTLTWKRYQAKGNIVDLADAIGNHEHATAYAFCVLQTPTAENQRLGLSLGLSSEAYRNQRRRIETSQFEAELSEHDFVLAQSDVPTDVQIHLGSDDGVAVWINGQLAHHNTVSSRSVPLDEDMFEADLKAGANRCLLKVSQGIGGWGFAVRMDALSPNRAVLSGVITDEAGQPIPSADVRLEQVERSEIPSIGNGEEIAEAQTDASGSYRLDIYPVRGQYALSATSGNMGDWRLNIQLGEGECRTLNLTLKEAVSIEGILLMLDDATPHVAVVVQAVLPAPLSLDRREPSPPAPLPEGEGSKGEDESQVVATTLSDENGKYRFINLKQGRYQVRYYTLDGYVYYQRGKVLQVECGKTLRNIDFHFAPFKKGTWKNLTYLDGLADNYVTAIHRAPDGAMWFTTVGGISRYDGKEFKNLTEKDGLAGNVVHAIHQDADGVLWFGTFGGVSRYDGKEFVNFTTEDGLADDRIRDIHRDTDGVMWFATWGGGVSRYEKPLRPGFDTQATQPGAATLRDGKSFINFTTKDGLVDNRVQAIYRDTESVMWFATEGGVSRYDAKGFVSFATKDGLADSDVSAIHRASDRVMWFSTYGGVSRYDGKSFSNFTTEDGLVHNAVTTIHRAPDGALWFGTYGGGVSHYDGKSFSNITAKDGLVNDIIMAICSEPDGVMWFGTEGGGVSRYDGREFASLTAEDGLAANWVYDIHCAPDGALWFGMEEGVSRYDGKSFSNFTTKDGLVHRIVYAIYSEPDGVMWFGTHGGVSRYDGKEITSFTNEDGLVNNIIIAIHIDPGGTLWFGTRGGGVACYDGTAWTSLDTRDGLANNVVQFIHRDVDGRLWFGTEGGITRYRPSTVPPKVQIVSVTIDRTYLDLDAIPAFTPGTRVTIEYNSIDFVTVPEKRQYRCHIKEIDPDWHKPTKATSFDWIPEKPGVYSFEVQAIDRDLNYSEPATLSLTVQPDPVLVSMKTKLNHLRREVRRKYQFDNIIGHSDSMKYVYSLMEKAIDSGLTVLISGETGTGKELVAKAIHYNSPRKDQPLQELNCGAIPKDLVAGTLFGHRKGAFTGAHEDKTGLFEVASGGTVLLDEIGEMPEDAQVHLLRVLQERKIQRIGETQLHDVDVRVIAITNRDLMAEVEAEHFREDLFYRLSVFPIHVPPLRERADDISLLAEHFLREACRQQNKKLDGFATPSLVSIRYATQPEPQPRGFAPGVMEMLQSYAWPGNVRELEHEIARAVALVEEGLRIQTYHFSSRVTREESLIQNVLSEPTGYRESLDRLSRRLVGEALRESGGNRTQAARRLKMDRSNLRALIKRLKIEV